MRYSEYLHGPSQFVSRDFTLKDARIAFQVLKRNKLVYFSFAMREDSDKLCGSGYQLTGEGAKLAYEYLGDFDDHHS